MISKRPSKSKSERSPIAPSKSGKNNRSPVRSLVIGFGLTAIALVSASVGALLAVSLSSAPLRQSNLSPEEAKVFDTRQTIAYRNLQFPALSRPVNILVVGTKVLTSDVPEAKTEDVGYHALVDSFDGLTDTMLLLRFDPASKKLTMLSIPRDTRTNIEGYGERKINEANSLGGPALTAETVSELLGGVAIDRYVRVNVQGLEKLIDALGGVTIDVPKDMKYNDFSQHFYIDLKKGKQHLDGAKAVQFSRFRHDAYGDIGRVQRQQQLMRAVMEQALQPGALLKIPDILKVIQTHIDTNLTLEELLALAGFATEVDRSNLQMVLLPGDFSGDGHKSVSYWLPNEEKIQDIAARYFDHGQVNISDNATENLRITVQDSLDDPDAVRSMVRSLETAGYHNIIVARSKVDPPETTKIIAQNGDDRAAATLRGSIGIGEVLVESTGNLASDVTIQLGRDWQNQSGRSPDSGTASDR
ncbi:LCP family protein [Pannus brasiliensis]|uniref:LCP family protein n=1 Tax=Pannus brasiliensis TaxID=1579216 RepID=UPI003BEF10EE